MHSSGEFVNEDIFVSSDEILSEGDNGNVYRYVSEIGDLDLGRYSGIGMTLFGVAVLMSLLVISVFSWLKRE